MDTDTARYEDCESKSWLRMGAELKEESEVLAHVVVEECTQRLEGAVTRVLGVIVQKDVATAANELACANAAPQSLSSAAWRWLLCVRQ